ncbi:DUF4304 domain-containing protein [Archangium sp.]|uniref:DUF4304 domain-containing protein n=1 Tax=Archangium sp. TaxID=1872627 RepID=UPI002D608D67|nr:DUF4304 domain-containing protein [Archangium sp.]HYO54986.1 DUF4304 domain-containing protein [Archangium sp.]
MKASSSPVKTAMAHELRRAGFKARATNWYKHGPDALLVVNLQKSLYGPQYYINLAIWVKQLGEAETPKEYQCHIRVRATSLPTDKAEALGRALNLKDESMNSEQREAFIAEFMREEAIPLLESLGTWEGIRAAVDAGKLKKGLVYREVEALLRQQATPK